MIWYAIFNSYIYITILYFKLMSIKSIPHWWAAFTVLKTMPLRHSYYSEMCEVGHNFMALAELY